MKTSTSLILGSILVLATLVVTAAFTLPTLKKTEEVKKEVVTVPTYVINSKAKEVNSETYSQKAFELLEATGFTTSKTYKDMARDKSKSYASIGQKKWSKLGFVFYDDQSFEDTLRVNKLSTVWASNYKGTIPEKNIFEISQNLNKLIETGENLYILLGSTVHLRNSTYDDKYIVNIACPNNEINLDPIVVVKVNGGWVQLSRW